MRTLRIAMEQVRLNPPESVSDQGDLLTLMHWVYRPLSTFRKGVPAPDLLESWVPSSGGRTWVLKVRSEALPDHQGRVSNAQDVREAMERLRDAPGPFGMESPYASYMRQLRFQTIDSSCLRVESEQPCPELPDLLTGVFVGTLDSHSMDAWGPGPLRILDGVDGEWIRLQPRDATDLPWDQVECMAIPSAELRWRALTDGEVDVANGLEELRGYCPPDGIVTHLQPHILSVIGFLNGFSAPFEDPRARLAVNYAVDVDRIIREVWEGLAVPASTVVSPDHYGFPRDLEPLPHDPDMARRLLAVCELSAPLILRTPQIIPNRAQEVCDRIAEDLHQVGVECVVEVQSDRPLYAREVHQHQIGDLALFDSSPQSSFRILREKISSRHRGDWWQGVQDEQVDQWIEEAQRLPNERERFVVYQRMLRWLRDHPHWLYLYHPIKRWAARAEIDGISMDESGRWVLGDTTRDA